MNGNVDIDGGLTFDGAGASIEGITTDLNASSAANELVTAAEVKDYVDTKVGNQGLDSAYTYGNTIQVRDAIGDMTVALNGTSSFIVDGGTGDVTVDQSGAMTAGNGLTVFGSLALDNNAIDDIEVEDALTISGGTINNTPIGATTRSTGAFTTLDANSTLNITGAATFNSTLDVTGITSFDGNVNLGDAASDVITITGGITFNETTNNLALEVADQSAAGSTLQFPDLAGATRTILTNADLTLQGAYNGGQTINAPTSNLTVNLSNTADFLIQDNGSTFFTASDAGVVTIDEIRLDGNTIASTSGNLTIAPVSGANADVTTLGVGVINLDGAAGVNINSSNNGINIGNDADAQPVNIGTGAASRTITIGNTTGSTAVNILAGTGNVDLTGNVNISAGADVTGTLQAFDNTVLGSDNSDNISFNGAVLNDGSGFAINFEGATDDGIQTRIIIEDPQTTSKEITFPNATGTVLLQGNVDLQDAFDAGQTIAAGGNNFITNLNGAGNFIIQDAGTPFFTANSNGEVIIDQLQLDGNSISSASGAISISPASNNNFTVNTAGTGQVDINSANGVTIDAAAASNLSTSAGLLTLAGASGVDINGGGASSITATGAALTLETVTSGLVDINSAGAIQADAAAGISLDAAGASNFSTSAGLLTLSGAGGVDVDGTGNSAITANSGNLTLETSTSGDVILNSANTVDVNAAASVTIDAASDNNVTITTSGSGFTDIDGDVNLGTNGTTFSSIVRQTVSVDPPSIPNGSSVEVSVNVTGAAVGGSVFASPAGDLGDDDIIVSYARVTAANTVVIKFHSRQGGGPAIDLGPTDWYISVINP